MNTSTNTNQNLYTTTGAARFGFVRRNMAGALLAMAFASTGIGFAATSYADDDGAQVPNFAGATRPDATCKTEP